MNAFSKLSILAFIFSILFVSCSVDEKEMTNWNFQESANNRIEYNNHLQVERFIALSDLFKQKNEIRKSIDYLDSALSFSNSNGIGEIHYREANCYSALKEYNSAIDHYTLSISSEYNLDSSYYLRALCFEKKHNRQAAVDDLRKAIALNHSDANVLHEKINPERRRVAYYVTRCCDGSDSSAKGRGACSHHGGVCNWNEPVYANYRKY